MVLFTYWNGQWIDCWEIFAGLVARHVLLRSVCTTGWCGVSTTVDKYMCTCNCIHVYVKVYECVCLCVYRVFCWKLVAIWSRDTWNLYKAVFLKDSLCIIHIYIHIYISIWASFLFWFNIEPNLYRSSGERWRFSKISLLLNDLYEINQELTFECIFIYVYIYMHIYMYILALEKFCLYYIHPYVQTHQYMGQLHSLI